MKCKEDIDHGISLRYGTTVISLLFLYFTKNYFGNYLYPAIALLLSYLDVVDGTYATTECHMNFYYQSRDKICDLASYILALFLFPIDRRLVLFTLYRAIGVVLFTLKKDASWLIMFLDFIKEYYFIHLTGKPSKLVVTICVGIKVLFEYYWHTFLNQRRY
jgi:hypothetical protein